MATPDEIERRVEENDAARSVRRAAAAKRVGELAQRRVAVVEQLGEIERELGNVLADAQDVIDIDELARFTDVPASDLTQWLTARTARKSTRAKRKRPAGGAQSAENGTRRRPSTVSRNPAPPAQSSGTNDGTADAPTRVPARVG